MFARINGPKSEMVSGKEKESNICIPIDYVEMTSAINLVVAVKHLGSHSLIVMFF